MYPMYPLLQAHTHTPYRRSPAQQIKLMQKHTPALLARVRVPSMQFKRANCPLLKFESHQRDAEPKPPTKYNAVNFTITITANDKYVWRKAGRDGGRAACPSLGWAL